MKILSCRTTLGNELPEFLDVPAVIDWALTSSKIWSSTSCQPLRFLRIRHFIARPAYAVVWSTIFQKFYMLKLVSFKIAAHPRDIVSLVRHITSEEYVFTNLECIQLVSTAGAYSTWCDFWVYTEMIILGSLRCILVVSCCLFLFSAWIYAMFMLCLCTLISRAPSIVFCKKNIF